ncbi:FMN-dependent oxidoreductase (nitrilotriacetate monooxygenase family) [Rhodococcus sp. 27YEA15]|uniref:NtaA/DmoA family FMN-dependent monooxygenase n=1 Tax=Rhodococcus sp. 27YEA15 TaxID=3156259 RepID=UPI003C7A3D14
MTRTAHLNAFLSTGGYHESGWLVQDYDASVDGDISHYRQAARTAERGLFDSVFLADVPSLTKFRAKFFPQIRWDPVTLLAVLGADTSTIGLFGTGSTTYSEPYELARRFSTLDHATGGRAGWNVVTTAHAAAAENFGRAGHPEHDDRYARAVEFVEVARALWDGWEEDAIVADRSRGIWAEPDRIHPAEFHGEYYDVAGALPVPRSPQGHPVLAQAGSSPAGVDLAGRIADVVFTPQPTIAAGKEFRAKIDAASIRHGRAAGSVRILPGLAFVLGSTEDEARRRRRELEDRADPELRWRNLAYHAGLDQKQIDPLSPLSPELAATAEGSTFAQFIVTEALASGRPFGELGAVITGLPGGLEFTGTPEQLANLIEEWVAEGGSDGFTLQPTTVPESLELFVDHVVPILQKRGVHRTEYQGSTLREHLGLAEVPSPHRQSVALDSDRR